jgi:hypothetical protein
MDNIPEKFKMEDGTLNADALLKSYSELEKKLGTMISLPNGDDDVDGIAKFRRAIGVPDDANEYEISKYDSENDSIRKKFHEIGLTKSQVNEIYKLADEFLEPLMNNFSSAQTEVKELSELEKFFGDKNKMQSALRDIETFGKKYLPDDVFETLSSTSKGIQSIYAMMNSTEPKIQTQKNQSQNFSESDLRRMMQDPKYWRDKDSEYIRTIENGFKKLFA